MVAVGLALAGCQTLKPKPKPVPAPPPVVATSPEPAVAPPAPKVVRLPPRSCVPRNLGPPPRYPDTDLALRTAPGAADRYQLLAAGRLLRQRRLEDLERVITACR
jgi:hypothetical protein